MTTPEGAFEEWLDSEPAPTGDPIAIYEQMLRKAYMAGVRFGEQEARGEFRAFTRTVDDFLGSLGANGLDEAIASIESVDQQIDHLRGLRARLDERMPSNR